LINTVERKKKLQKDLVGSNNIEINVDALKAAGEHCCVEA